MKFLLPLLLMLSLPVTGQNWYLKRSIPWNHPEASDTVMTFKDITSFAKSDYENNNSLLPRYFDIVRWQQENPEVKVSFFRAEYQAVMPDAEAEGRFSDLGDSILIDTHISIGSGKPFLQFGLLPFRKNPVTGSVERLISFVLKVESTPLARAQTFRESPKKGAATAVSLLSTGNWYKIRVKETGIYKLTYDQLATIGLTNPANVRVFGWGGICLPDDARLGEQDDLREVQLYMNKGSDGIFNAGDYILFYGSGPVTWSWDKTDSLFVHDLNPYSDYGYYFITSDKGAASAPAPETVPGSPASRSTSTFDARDYHELEDINALKYGQQKGSGREWYGEEFETTNQRTFSFSFPAVVKQEPVKFKTSVIGRSRGKCGFIVYANNVYLDSIKIRSANLSEYTATWAYSADSVFSFFPSGENLQLKYRFIKPDSDTKGFLDYISINARSKLEMNGDMLLFRDSRGISDSSVTSFNLANATGNTVVWDVSDIHDVRKVNGNLSGSNFSFTAPTTFIREFVAFDAGGSFPAPVYQGEGLGKVENQNIHGAGFPQYIVVTHPDFLSPAERLAAYRKQHNHLQTLVVTTDQVYNEFSSGRLDITAIRNMMRYFYKNAAGDSSKLPKYLLLFGDGSFDNKNTDPSNGNFVPTYQSVNSLSPTASYVSDDYYVLLDDGEDMYYGLLDAGVGRLPVTDVSEAEAMVDKIIGYENPDKMGDWRNSLCFIGDDQDWNTHFDQANSLANSVESRYPYFNINKIFLDAYPQVTMPDGQRYPDVNRAINDQVERGALIVNYNGHGGIEGLAHEHIVEKSDITSWNNAGKLPLFMTATCEFSRFDDPSFTSAGEMVLLNEHGGGIALLTTTRLVYAGPNFQLNEHFYDIVFTKDSLGRNYCLGEVMKYSKNKSSSGINKRNFTLLGDPAMRLTYPLYHVATDSVNHQSVEVVTDTLTALKKVSISGHIENNDGTLLNGFNGIIYPVAYDKPTTQTTLGNDGGQTRTFQIRNSIIYKGKASVKNGYFSFEFFVPKDISYAIGDGKLSYYAQDSAVDAAGAWFKIRVGGSSPDAETDVSGPGINIYMNNEYFKPGGITDPNPLLLVKVYDEHGINTTGNGIGHDITGVLDDNIQSAIPLNEYYTSDLNSYQSGTVEYPLSKLTAGPHTINVKVWDIYNNSNQASIDFVVVTSADMILDNLLNFPNPFTENTSISFEHNNPGTDMDITIDIYNMAGKLMKTIKTREYNSGFRSKPVEWNGYDESGNKSRQGMYIYRIHVRSSDGREASKSGKMIIVR